VRVLDYATAKLSILKRFSLMDLRPVILDGWRPPQQHCGINPDCHPTSVWVFVILRFHVETNLGQIGALELLVKRGQSGVLDFLPVLHHC